MFQGSRWSPVSLFRITEAHGIPGPVGCLSLSICENCSKRRRSGHGPVASAGKDTARESQMGICGLGIHNSYWMFGCVWTCSNLSFLFQLKELCWIWLHISVLETTASFWLVGHPCFLLIDWWFQTASSLPSMIPKEDWSGGIGGWNHHPDWLRGC